ncbi:MAG TPA: ABC transporter permease [Peptococcaceae bacterium]|nr:ABC transporter permease [Peptococcaceae bacterium]
MTLKNHKHLDNNLTQLNTNGKDAVKIIIRGIAFPLTIIIIWEFAARLGLVNQYFLPSPSKIFDTFSTMFISGELGRHLLASVKRLIYGFLITVIFAIPLGILVGKAKYFRYYVNPTLSFLQQIPPIAWIPIFILWLGIDEANKVAVIVYASFFPVFLNTVQGVNSVDPKLVEVGRAYMLTPMKMVCRIYIPSAVMSIFVGLRLGLSNCWRALVGAELIAASSGIGYLITEGRTLSQPNTIFVAIFTIGIAGSLLDLSLKRAEKKLMPWKKDV